MPAYNSWLIYEDLVNFWVIGYWNCNLWWSLRRSQWKMKKCHLLSFYRLSIHKVFKSIIIRMQMHKKIISRCTFFFAIFFAKIFRFNISIITWCKKDFSLPTRLFFFCCRSAKLCTSLSQQSASNMKQVACRQGRWCWIVTVGGSGVAY